VKYENPRVVVRSLLTMESDDVMWLSCDTAGSHVIDALLASPTVKSVKKRKFAEKLKVCNRSVHTSLSLMANFCLQPYLVSLCKDKHGSRVVDSIWRSSDIATKEGLATDLLRYETELAEDFYGRIVMRNCNISHYRRKQEVWQEKIAVAAKTRELFHDILEEEETDAVAVGTGLAKKKRSSQEPAVPRQRKKRRKH
jgi:nucleolar protein 9